MMVRIDNTDTHSGRRHELETRLLGYTERWGGRREKGREWRRGETWSKDLTGFPSLTIRSKFS